GQGDGTSRVTAHLADDVRQVTAWPRVPFALDRNMWGIAGLTPEKRLHLVPACKRFVVIAPSNDRLLLYPFDADQELQRSGIDYLFVASRPPAIADAGAEFRYRVEVRSKHGGVRIKLESGPEGM